MKFFAIIFSLFFVTTSLGNSSFAAVPSNAKQVSSPVVIKAKVRGLVCAFCSRNIEKSFQKRSEVEKVSADLDTKIVTIDLKNGENLSDEEVTKIITDAGYNVSEINR
jgi:copper chaperone CopZ